MEKKALSAMVEMKKAAGMTGLFLLFVFLFMVGRPEGAYAADAVKFLQTNGAEGTVVNYVEVNKENIPDSRPSLNGNDHDTTWYVVKEDVTYNNRIDVTHTVNLVLCDGATLTANKGIYVAQPYGGNLTVYAQSTDKDKMGKIVAWGPEDWSGIGGNDGDMTCGSIYFIGGDIKAVGGENAAGIGGGYKKEGGTLCFNGGYIDAQGGDDAAGIGGGQDADGGKITINGGNITSRGGEDGAGIGGGSEGSGGEITVNGGTVKTDGGAWGAGMGGGYYAHAGKITINGGRIDSRGTGGVGVPVFGTDGSGAGIGAGAVNKKGKNNAEWTAGGTIIINGGDIYAGGGTVHQNGSYNKGGAGIGNGNDSNYGCRIEIHGGKIKAVPGSGAAGIGGGFDSYGGTIIIDNKTTDGRQGDPTIESSCQGADAPGASYEYYCIGSGDSDEEPANVSFNYPNSKVYIYEHWGSWKDVDRTVNADERASIVRCGSATFNQIRISPCDHPGKTYDRSETGHIAKCRYCSLGEDGAEEAHKWEGNKCTVCGYERQAPAHEHDWGDWEVEAEADCSHEGSEVRKCRTDASHIERRSIPKNSDRHTSFGRKKENEKPATCTEYGQADIIVYCNDCGTTVSTTHTSIKPLGHDWEEWETVQEATETENGLEERVCANDPSHKESRIIPSAGHVHHLSKVAAKDATCTENGNHEYWICDQTEDACGRMYADEAGTVDATEEQVTIYAAGHKPGKETRENEVRATCAGAASYDAVIRCEVCGMELSRQKKTAGSALGHRWGSWKVIKKATAVMAGTEQRCCLNDPAHIQKRSIPATGVSGTLLVKMTPKGKKSMTVSWSRIEGADGYEIYFAKCKRNDKKSGIKRVKTVKGNGTLQWKKSGLKKKTAYKAYVKAYVMKNGKKSYVRTSPLMHAYTSGGNKKYTNAGSISLRNASITLQKGQTHRLTAKAVKLKKNKKLMPKGHAAAVRYLSSNKKVATVTKNGTVRARGKGTCFIYAYAHNGISRSVRVTVK